MQRLVQNYRWSPSTLKLFPTQLLNAHHAHMSTQADDFDESDIGAQISLLIQQVEEDLMQARSKRHLFYI